MTGQLKELTVVIKKYEPTVDCYFDPPRTPDLSHYKAALRNVPARRERENFIRPEHQPRPHRFTLLPKSFASSRKYLPYEAPF